MKPISAVAVAKKAAEAIEVATALAIEEAETKKQRNELARTRALRERALYIALMRAAIDGKSELIWKDDQANLSQLGRRGFWIYEHGVFDWLYVWERLREWHLYYLGAIEEKWKEDVAYELKITDAKALRKLFGGSESFSKLHRPFLSLLFNELKNDRTAISAVYSSCFYDDFEQILLRCLQGARQDAVRGGHIESELAGWTFWQYDEIYGGIFMNELVSESRRLSSHLRSLLIDSGSPASYLGEFDSMTIEGLSSLGFDPCKGRVESRIENSFPIFKIMRIIKSEYSNFIKGGILHPAIAQYYSGSKKEIKYDELYEVKYLRIYWANRPGTWRPFANVVDECLLNWLGGGSGQRFLSLVFDRIESAAITN